MNMRRGQRGRPIPAITPVTTKKSSDSVELSRSLVKAALSRPEIKQKQIEAAKDIAAMKIQSAYRGRKEAQNIENVPASSLKSQLESVRDRKFGIGLAMNELTDKDEITKLAADRNALAKAEEVLEKKLEVANKAVSSITKAINTKSRTGKFIEAAREKGRNIRAGAEELQKIAAVNDPFTAKYGDTIINTVSNAASKVADTIEYAAPVLDTILEVAVKVWNKVGWNKSNEEVVEQVLQTVSPNKKPQSELMREIERAVDNAKITSALKKVEKDNVGANQEVIVQDTAKLLSPNKQDLKLEKEIKIHLLEVKLKGSTNTVLAVLI